jgi:hypothetical protein
MKKITYYVLDDKEFEDLVKNNLKVSEFDFIAYFELTNDTSHAFYDLDGSLSDLDVNGLEKFIELNGLGMYDVSIADLLNRLVELDALPNGNYLINICW